MDQPSTVVFTAFTDVWPWATRNGDRCRPMRHWRGKDFDFFQFFSIGILTRTSFQQDIKGKRKKNM